MLQNLWVHCPIVEKGGQLVRVKEVNKSVDRLIILWRNYNKTYKTNKLTTESQWITKKKKVFYEPWLIAWTRLDKPWQYVVIKWQKNRYFTSFNTLHATGWSKASWSEKETVCTSSLLKNWNHNGRASDSDPAKDHASLLKLPLCQKFKKSSQSIQQITDAKDSYKYNIMQYISKKTNNPWGICLPWEQSILASDIFTRTTFQVRNCFHKSIWGMYLLDSTLVIWGSSEHNSERSFSPAWVMTCFNRPFDT
jgi:hypothetical protein